MENKHGIGFQWKFLLKLLLTFFFLFVLWRLLERQQQSLGDVWRATVEHLRTGEGIWLMGLFLLVPVNWALESFKWQMLVAKVRRVTFFEALRSTLAGLLSGLALPAQIGEVVGRLATLNIDHRSKAVGAAVISGGIQFYTAVFGGLFGVFFLWEKLGIHRVSLAMLTGSLALVIIAGFVIFVFRNRLLKAIPGNRLGGKIKSSLEVISAYDNRELLNAFGVGVVRYGIYVAQFVAGLLLFDFSLSIAEMISCVALVLMIKTLMPALNLLGDLGLRGISAVFIFSKFGIAPDEVVAVTLLIWVTNILLPALIGLLLIWIGSRRFV